MGLEWSSFTKFFSSLCASTADGENTQIFKSNCSSNCCVNNSSVCVECDHIHKRENMKHICRQCYYSSKEILSHT